MLQKSITSTYGPSSWGGQLLASESFVDQVSGHEKYIAYETDGLISQIHGHICNNSTAAFLPWKQKSYNYDEAGRLTAKSIRWSPEVDFPTGSVSQYTIQKAYDFNAKTSTYTETTTDPLGQASSMSYAMQIKGGPLVQKVSAMGSRETFAYDLLGECGDDGRLGLNNRDVVFRRAGQELPADSDINGLCYTQDVRYPWSSY